MSSSARHRSVISFCILLCASPAAAQNLPPVWKARARLIELPSSERCQGRQRVRVVSRYRVEEILSKRAPVAPRSEIYVIHECPRHPRGFSRYARGTVRSLKPGDSHLLRLRSSSPAGPLQDRFVDRPGVRYRALQTDPAPEPPLVIVRVEGGGGSAHRFSFSGDVLIGSDARCDVMLADRSVAPRHLRLVVDGDKIKVAPIGRARVKVGKEPLKAPRAVTFTDTISFGRYRLTVSLLTAAWFRAMKRDRSRYY